MKHLPILVLVLSTACGTSPDQAQQPDGGRHVGSGSGSDSGSDSGSGSGSDSGSGSGSGSDVGSGSAISCTANAFDHCDGSDAVSCNADGDGFADTACSFGCSDAHGCNACEPNAESCVGNSLQACGSDGEPVSKTACDQICIASGTPHCEHVVPRYVPDACDAPSTTTALDVTATGSIDTDDDAVCNGGIIHQAGAIDICVVRAPSITVAAGAHLTASGARVLALVSDGPLTIHGTLDASAHGTASGPGAFGSSGGAPVAGGTTGGGGAGFQTAGGRGGGVTNNGGAASGDPADLGAIVGGPSAGGGGGGGGAVILVSCEDTVSVDGTLVAGGGGGTAGGFGGGAGGYMVLEGVDIDVTGAVFANGGGGGAGLIKAGSDATASVVRAPGGAAQLGGGGGGEGAIAGVNGADGTAATQSGKRAGGGGGGIGWFQAYVPAGKIADLQPASASPGFQPTRAITLE